MIIGNVTMNCKIMIVDDEEHIRRLYTEELQDEGYNVVTLSTGFRILEKVEREKPDLIILDVKLIDYNGLELLHLIKERFPWLPAGLCSAYDTFMEDMKSIIADFYVIKSYDLSELKNNIAWTLDQFRQNKLHYKI